MAGDTERLVVSLEARLRDFEKNFQRAGRTADTSFSRIERRAEQSAKRLEASLKGGAANINGILGSIGAGIGLREITRLSDSYTQFTNQLRVAGREGTALAQSQAALFGIAQRYGVELEAVGTLYGRNAAAAKELGLSEAQQLRIVEATAAALKVSGASAQSASGALLQLSQALGGPMIQAQEFNSLLDGARPLLQAVANGSERWGGSVAKLTADVKAGKVATADFIEALLKGSQGTLDQAAKSALTFSGATTILTNALTKFVGEMDQASGVSQALTGGIVGAANNLPALTGAAAAAAAVITSKYVPGLARAALAQTAMIATNPFLLLATVIGGAAFALGAFGDDIKPIEGDLASLGDYAAVAWDDVKSGAAIASATVQEAFGNLAGFIAEALGGAQISMDDLASFAKLTANVLLNSFVLVYDVLVASFTKLPTAIAEAILDGVNKIIAGVESALNFVIGGVNSTIEAINKAGKLVGVELGTIGNVDLGRIKNGYAGAGEAAGKAYLDALRKTTKDRVGEALDGMRERANERAAKRAGEPKSEPKPPLSTTVPNKGNAKPDKESLNGFEREIQQIKERTALLLVEAEARRTATGSLEEQEAAVERARIVHDLLNAAQREGVEINDEVRASVGKLADAYIAASQEAEALAKAQRESARQQEEVNNQLRDLEQTGSDAMKGLVKDLISGKRPADALAAAIGKISDKLIDLALNQLFDGLFAGLLTGKNAGGVNLGGAGASSGGINLGAIFGGMFSSPQQRTALQSVPSALVPSTLSKAIPPAVAAPAVTAPAVATGSFKEVGNYVARGADKVDPRLHDILKSAAERSGYRVEAFSGYRPGDKRFHGKGLATDVQIIDPKTGKPLPNYQDAASFRDYETYAQEARRVQLEKYPELGEQFRWGGYFGGRKGDYGALDTMHFDLGGSKRLGMSGGSWERGLTANQRKLFPGAQSVGMNEARLPDTRPVDTRPANTESVANLDALTQGQITPAMFNKRIPAAIRTNNPGAMWYAPWQKKYGVLGKQGLNDGLGQGNNAAMFPTPEAGMAAKFELWNRRDYANLDMGSALRKWSGGNSTDGYIRHMEKAGFKRDTVMRDIMADPEKAASFMQHQTKWEIGGKAPWTEDQWRTGYALYRQKNGLPVEQGPQYVAQQGSQQAVQQATQQQQQAIQQQIEAQRRLAEQSQITTGSLQQMPPPIQGVQSGMQGLEGGLGGMIGQLGAGVPVVGQFSGVIQQMLQQLASSGGMGGLGGGGGLFAGLGGILGFADGGHVSGPGTATSDSIPAMLSNGEFVVNAKSTKRHRAALEAINTGRVPAFAKGGFVGSNSFANSYSPTLNINVAGINGGNAMAGQIASAVGKTLDQSRPDSFRRSSGQQMAEAGVAMQRATRRHS